MTFIMTFVMTSAAALLYDIAADTVSAAWHAAGRGLCEALLIIMKESLRMPLTPLFAKVGVFESSSLFCLTARVRDLHV